MLVDENKKPSSAPSNHLNAVSPESSRIHIDPPHLKCQRPERARDVNRKEMKTKNIPSSTPSYHLSGFLGGSHN